MDKINFFISKKEFINKRDNFYVSQSTFYIDKNKISKIIFGGFLKKTR